MVSSDGLHRYKLDPSIAPANKTVVDPRIIAMYTKVTELVGIGEAKEEVIARLTLTRGDDDDDHKERIVVSIAGFGGLGKTTLARAVYDEIKQQFDCTAFVSVSRNPDMKKLLKDILYGLDSKDKFKDIHSKMLDETQLIDLIHEFLKNRRYICASHLIMRIFLLVLRCVTYVHMYKELETTQTALREVGEVPREHLSEPVKLWARDVREVSYDMVEDIVDTFTVRVQGRKRPRESSAIEFIKEMANIVTEFKTRRDIAQEIKGIQERVTEVAERRDRLSIISHDT